VSSLPATQSATESAPALVALVTTVGSADDARRLADAAIAQRLAACVQVEGPVTSIYRWQGRVETAEEWRCACKTTAGRRADCVARILAGHDYQTPQVTCHSLTATSAYAAWVRESVEPS